MMYINSSISFDSLAHYFHRDHESYRMHILVTFHANALISSKDFAVNYLKLHECISFSRLLT